MSDNSHSLRVDRILQKLAEVQRKKLTGHGAEQHKCFRLNPPVDQKTLENFERDQKVTLPTDYRCFLTLAGNGGAGPYAGLHKLDHWREFLEGATDDVPADVLSLPSPLRPSMSRGSDWESKLGQCVSPYQGTIAIGSQGGVFEIGLIVTGKCAGRVVYLYWDGDAPYLVREPDFLSWYERWLDELLGGYDIFWFGFGIGGDESHLLALLNDPDTSDADRADAVSALKRLPKLSSQSQNRIVGLAVDPVSEVRAAACRVAEKFEIRQLGNQLPALLSDESPEVQAAAINLNKKLAANLNLNQVIPLLDSIDMNVATQAFVALKEQGCLDHKTLLRLIRTSPHSALRAYATRAVHAVHWEPEDEELLLKLLNDQDTEIRLHAVLGLRRISPRSALNAVIDLLNRETDSNIIDTILWMLGGIPCEQSSQVLLDWCEKEDDCRRLTAIDSLCKLGDIRVAPIAKRLLQEKRPPQIKLHQYQLPLNFDEPSISERVSESLRSSSNQSLRQLVPSEGWLQWLRNALHSSAR